MGGLVLAPVIAITGMFMAGAARKNKNKARDCKYDAFKVADTMDEVTEASKDIKERVKDIVCPHLECLDSQWGEYMDKIEAIIQQKTGDIAQWNDKEKRVLQDWQQLSDLITIKENSANPI